MFDCGKNDHWSYNFDIFRKSAWGLCEWIFREISQPSFSSLHWYLCYLVQNYFNVDLIWLSGSQGQALEVTGASQAPNYWVTGKRYTFFSYKLAEHPAFYGL